MPLYYADRAMEARVEELKRYVRFTDDDAGRLRAFAVHAAPHFRRIAQEFYERIREHEDAHAVFTGEEQIRRLQDSMVRWLERVFGGVYNVAYFAKTEQIGRVHVRVGLPQRYMLTAMAVIRSSLTAVIDQSALEDAASVGDALSRLLDIELAVMLESYRADMMNRVERAAQHRIVLSGSASAQDLYFEAVELAPLLVVGLDARGAVVLFNREAERKTGYARDEVVGRSFAQILLPEEVREEGATLAAGITDSPRELPLLTRSGKIRDIHWQVANEPAAVEGGVARFIIGADVTEERIERERKQQQKRLAAVGTLAAGLAHEIRNPLNGARLHVAFLERALAKGDCSADTLDAVHVVGDEIRRLARLVTEFLDFARPQPFLWASVDVRALCERVIQLTEPAAKSANVSIERDFPAHTLTFDGDAQRLEQVLLNLIQNATEALAPQNGGKVVVRARREPRHVWIEVEDDGPGIGSEAPSIFDAFYSTKANGTGLGLAIAHRIVTDHQGTIDVDSRPGRTRFRVKLPLTRQETEA
jgi:PAS domain S-box-containing protein